MHELQTQIFVNIHFPTKVVGDIFLEQEKNEAAHSVTNIKK